MLGKLKRGLRKSKKFSSHLKSGLGFLMNHKDFLSQPSYYDESNKKSNFRIISEMFNHILKYGEVDKFYFAYGLDQKGRRSNDYLEFHEFMNARNRKNYTRPFDYLCILRDKNIFSIVAKAFRIPAATNMGVLCNGVVFSDQGQLGEKDIFADTDSIFIKAISGECGQKVFKVHKNNKGDFLLNDSIKESWESVIEYFKAGEFKDMEFVIQKCLRNHPVIDQIYPHSINTIRLITIKNPSSNKPEPFAAILRIGAHGNIVDNTSMGGLAIKINLDGTLDSEAFYKPGYGTKTKIHPDTKFTFDGTEIPYFKECIKICCDFHQKLGIHSIGWDVAITPSGPAIIEGNDNWEITSLQAIWGPLRQRLSYVFDFK